MKQKELKNHIPVDLELATQSSGTTQTVHVIATLITTYYKLQKMEEVKMTRT